MDSHLSHRETWTLLAIFAVSIGVAANTFEGNGDALVASLAFSGIAFAVSYSLIRWLGDTFMKANLKGRDMSKVKQNEIPETMGGVCAAVYLLLIILFMPCLFYTDVRLATNVSDEDTLVMSHGSGRLLHRFPLQKLATYQSSILSLALVVILGNYDDLFDIRWRHKVLIPGIASIPMLAVYYLTYGVTHVVVPVPLEGYLGQMIDIGWLYYLYMGAIAIFCPNSINIFAGINGIEVSQSIVISVLLLANDILSLMSISGGTSTHPATELHLFSIYLILPFIGTSLALWWHNWYPAKVFVGDTYCYFAGMMFAIVAILGHFSKTLLLLFIPQIFNFLYSMPQLFHLVPCPRHRLPRFKPKTGLLEPSMTVWTKPPTGNLARGLELLAAVPGLPLLKIIRDNSGQIAETSNFTLINLWLVWWGPKREDRLATELIVLQTLVGIVGLLIRHELALLVFHQDNRYQNMM